MTCLTVFVKGLLTSGSCFPLPGTVLPVHGCSHHPSASGLLDDLENSSPETRAVILPNPSSTILLQRRLEGYPHGFLLAFFPRLPGKKKWMGQHFKPMNVLQGHTLSTEAIMGKVGTLIISRAGNEGEEISKQPIIMIRYQRFVLGHTPIKTNFNAVRSNVMNLLYFF